MRIGAVDWRPADGYSEVQLPDGRVIPARPHATSSYAAQAAALGYPDGAAMNREHDAIHAFTAGIFGTVSPVLRHVADLVGAAPADRRDRRRPAGAEMHWQEEELVLMLSARLNDPARDGEPGGGLVRHLRTLLRGE
jgi:hypothetical protein